MLTNTLRDRFRFRRFGDWSSDEIKENERMWREENMSRVLQNRQIDWNAAINRREKLFRRGTDVVILLSAVAVGFLAAMVLR